MRAPDTTIEAELWAGDQSNTPREERAAHELMRQRLRISELEAALSAALAYCDEALHQTDQYSDERGRLIAVLDGKQ